MKLSEWFLYVLYSTITLCCCHFLKNDLLYLNLQANSVNLPSCWNRPRPPDCWHIHKIFIPLEKLLSETNNQRHSFLLSKINIVGSLWNRSDRCGPLITVSMVWCSAKPWQHGLCWKCVMLQKPNKHIDWNIDEAGEVMIHRCTCSSNTRGIYFKTRRCMLFKVQKIDDL